MSQVSDPHEKVPQVYIPPRNALLVEVEQQDICIADLGTAGYLVVYTSFLNFL